jgi:hypothetical protein
MKKNSPISPSGILQLLFILVVFTACSNNKTESEKTSPDSMEIVTVNKKQLKHVVLFKFKESATKEDIEKVEQDFSALPSKIPQIRGYEWGINNSPEGLDKGFTHCFYLTFDSEEDRAIYLPHPDHKAFGAGLGPYLEDVLVVDYWTEN